jgi:hypothetical protein|nr:hypothetical protein [uncultured Mediterranean phage uvMED]|tara:strand:- start:591 stop:794 length:204 start_codon:yes stop_codon:yes gene_type:complete
MQIDLKALISYAPLILALGITWGVFSTRLDAVAAKVDNISQMQQDIAVIKAKVMWMEDYLVKNGRDK